MNDKLKHLDEKDFINKNIESKDELGYFKVSVNELPSMGLFYPRDTYIGVRPAGLKEIRQWSMIDERDDYSFIEAMDFVLSRCLIIKSETKNLTKKDILEVDRLYLVFAVREYTFNDPSNNVYIDLPYSFEGKEYKDSIVVTKEKLKYFTISKKLIDKFYSESKRAFILDDFEVRLPSIGISSWVQDYVQRKVRENKPVDEFFAKMASFILSDYQTLTDKVYFDNEVESQNWSIENVADLDRLVNILSSGASETIKHRTEHGGIEVDVPLMFRNGIKSIFLISSKFDDFD